MSFVDFVAIKLPKASPSTIDYKSMASYLASAGRRPDLSDEDGLRLWIAAMIEKGLTPASRKRYVEKLHTLYREYSESFASIDLIDLKDPMASLAPLRDYVSPCDPAEMRGHAATLAKVMDAMIADAKTRPSVALFLYMLFNADGDLGRTVSLKVEDYHPSLPQLDDFIDPGEFHHRRVYLFNLNQSRKRTPQLFREVAEEITTYLSYRGIRFSRPLTSSSVPSAIVSLWIASALEAGVAMDDITATLSSSAIPPEYGYLHHINGSGLTPEGLCAIQRRVAERLSPSESRWYAMKLRRGVSFKQMLDSMHRTLDKTHPGLCDDSAFFYPRRENSSRVDRRIVTEMVPVIPDIVFFTVRPRHVRKIDEQLRSEGLGWVFRLVNTPDSDYSVIDRASMLNFQLVIGVFTPDIKISLTREAPLGVGRRVRITGGLMAGYTGIIYDIKDNPGGTVDGARQIYIRLSTDYAVKVELHVDEFYVQPA